MSSQPAVWHGTTILSVRKGGQVVIAGDGQVSLGQTVIKGNAQEGAPPRRRRGDRPASPAPPPTPSPCSSGWRPSSSGIPGQLTRACVELAKDWRTDRYLRRLEAMMAVADRDVILVLTGTGDVLEPEDGVIGIGSGGNYALAAARALIDIEAWTPRRSPRKAMAIAAEICVYTNEQRHRSRPLEHRMTAPDPARDRLRARPLHRRPGGRQARRRHRAAQPLAPPAARRGAARGGGAEEHPDDRPHRLRQDRDRPPAGQAGQAPFLKVEATKFTEVGYVGRDVERSCATWSRSRSS